MVTEKAVTFHLSYFMRQYLCCWGVTCESAASLNSWLAHYFMCIMTSRVMTSHLPPPTLLQKFWNWISQRREAEFVLFVCVCYDIESHDVTLIHPSTFHNKVMTLHWSHPPSNKKIWSWTTDKYRKADLLVQASDALSIKFLLASSSSFGDRVFTMICSEWVAARRSLFWLLLFI